MNFAIGNSFQNIAGFTQRTLPDSKVNDIQARTQSINSGLFEHQVSTDLNAALEEQKSQSLVHQLMQAIARANQDPAASRSENAPSTSFTSSSNEISFSEFTLKSQALAVTNFSISQNIVNFQSTQTSQSTISMVNTNNNQALTIDFTQTNEFSLSTSFNANSTRPAEKSDPLILNLDNTDFDFNSDQKVNFDLNADGSLDSISNLSSKNAFLAYDKNNNGKIDNGSELFGDTGGALDGFADLANYDSNNDNQINAQDEIFKHLLLLNFDANGNQTSKTLTSQEIESLSLNYKANIKTYSGENLLISEASYQRKDGSLGRVGDFLLSLS